jgi:hypothetical protein
MSDTITQLPSAPLPTDTTAQFNEKAFNLVAALDTFVDESNILAASVEADAATAESAATTATTKAGEALASKNAAESAKDSALTYKTAAETAAASAASSYDAFDDRYLGAKSADPTTDNDGHALIEGAEYWNTVSKQRRTWDGLQWVATFVPAGDYLTNSDIGQSVQPYDPDTPTVAASQAEMEAGTEEALRSMSPLRVSQAIAALAKGSPEKTWSAYTYTNTYIVPSGISSIRAYAIGAGGNGQTSNFGSGGGGGGCAFGDISVTSGQTVSITISNGIASVSVGATTYLIANPGANGDAGRVGGTATKHASVTNGGAYSGGNGGTSFGGGGSAASPLGNGFNGGSGLGGGGGIGGKGGNGDSDFCGGGGGAGGAGGDGSSYYGKNGAGGGSWSAASYSTAGQGRPQFAKFSDPLLTLANGVGGNFSSDCGGSGGYGAGGGGAGTQYAQSGGSGGCFGGGGAVSSANTLAVAGDGGFMGGGGSAYTPSGIVLNRGGHGGYGGGGGCNTRQAGYGGPAIVIIYA